MSAFRASRLLMLQDDLISRLPFKGSFVLILKDSSGDLLVISGHHFIKGNMHMVTISFCIIFIDGVDFK